MPNSYPVKSVDDWLKEFSGKPLMDLLSNQMGLVQSAMLTGRDNLVVRVWLRTKDGRVIATVRDSLRRLSPEQLAEFEGN